MCVREIERESVCERERGSGFSLIYIYRILTHFTDFALDFFRSVSISKTEKTEKKQSNYLQKGKKKKKD